MVANIRIEPNSFFDDSAVKKILGLSSTAIGRACNSGELRFTERAGRRWFRGQWLIDWLDPSKDADEPKGSPC